MSFRPLSESAALPILDGHLDQAHPIDPGAIGERGGFFAIDHRCWAKACAIGMNAAVAYLMHARGSGRDQRTSNWSVQALETYTGISRSRAKAAIKSLQSSGLTFELQGGTRPQYEIRPWSVVANLGLRLCVAWTVLLESLAAGHQPTGRQKRSVEALLRHGIVEKAEDGAIRLPEPQWIWLPNEFVTGGAGETPPLELIRQSQDPMVLLLAVDLYRAQNLLEDGGVSRQVCWKQWERKRIGQRAQYVVWGFREEHTTVAWNEITMPHRRSSEKLSEAEKAAGKNGGVDFFARIQLLEDIGLVQWVPHLVESEDRNAEIIHALSAPGSKADTIEALVGEAAHDAAWAMLTEGQREWAGAEGFMLVPVLRHRGSVQVVSVARLRYRPKTSLTAAWWADQHKTAEDYVQQYADAHAHATGVRAS